MRAEVDANGLGGSDVREDVAFLSTILEQADFKLIESGDPYGRGSVGPLRGSDGEPLHGAYVGREGWQLDGRWWISLVANNGWLVDGGRHTRPSPASEVLRPMNYALAWAGWQSGERYTDGNDLAVQQVIARRKPFAVCRCNGRGQAWRLERLSTEGGLPSACNTWDDEIWFRVARTETIDQLVDLDALADYWSAVAPQHEESVRTAVAGCRGRSPTAFLDEPESRYLWDVASGADVGKKALQCLMFGYWPAMTASFFPEVQEQVRSVRPIFQGGRLTDHIPDLWDVGYAALRSAKDEATKRDRSPGRNDPCPCGSGRKLKHCHGGIPSP